MKTAVIYYSLDGNSAVVAETLKAVLNADVYQLKTIDAKKRRGFFKMVWGVGQVMRKKKPELLPLSIDLDAYDLLILGTPVWAGSPSPALVSFLDKTKISGRKVALFCSHRGGKGDVFGKIKNLLQGNIITGEIDFFEPAKADPAELKEKISAWIKPEQIVQP